MMLAFENERSPKSYISEALAGNRTNWNCKRCHRFVQLVLWSKLRNNIPNMAKIVNQTCSSLEKKSLWDHKEPTEKKTNDWNHLEMNEFSKKNKIFIYKFNVAQWKSEYKNAGTKEREYYTAVDCRNHLKYPTKKIHFQKMRIAHTWYLKHTQMFDFECQSLCEDSLRQFGCSLGFFVDWFRVDCVVLRGEPPE